MATASFALLRCPYCRQAFRFEEVPRPKTGAGEFGILRCPCSAFPVLDGIPIIQKTPVCMYENTTHAIPFSGTPIAELVRLVETGDPIQALLECLVVPKDLPAVLNRLLPWRVANGKRTKLWMRRKEKQRLGREVLGRRESIGAMDVLNYFFPPGSPLGYTLGQYFIRRFCQPRHLAALSLLANVPPDAKPLLDIACGLGHLEHYLYARNPPQGAVGMDLSFFHVWIARHWFARDGFFVCGDAGEGLPFADAAFSATLCSDAYHFIPNRPRLLAEIERCAPGRLVLLTRIGNKAVMPNEGVESVLEEYLAEFGANPTRVFSEGELLKAYLARENPFARKAQSQPDLRDSKWLSFAWNIPASASANPATAGDWPHAAGTPAWNPIYRKTELGDGKLRFNFEFPDPWYAYENNAMLSYHRRLVLVPREKWDAALQGKEPDLNSDLTKAFVLIGLPKHFR